MRDLFGYITEANKTSAAIDYQNSQVVFIKQNEFRVLLGYKCSIIALLKGHENHEYAKKILKNPSFNRVTADEAVVQIGFRNSIQDNVIKLIRIAKRKEHTIEDAVHVFEKYNEPGINLFTEFNYYDTKSYDQYVKFLEEPAEVTKYSICNKTQAKYLLLRQSSTTLLFTSKKNIEKLFKGSSNKMDLDILKNSDIVRADANDIFKITFYLGCEYGIPKNYYIDSSDDSYFIDYAVVNNQGRREYDDIRNGKIHNQNLTNVINSMNNVYTSEMIQTKSLTLEELRSFIFTYEYRK